MFTGFSIEGPSQAKIDCKDNGDGSADVTYWPTAPGEYAVHILCDEQDIPQAPYMAQIQPATTEFDASKVRGTDTLTPYHTGPKIWTICSEGTDPSEARNKPKTWKYSRLSLSRIPRDSETLQDIRTSKYQSCRSEENNKSSNHI